MVAEAASLKKSVTLEEVPGADHFAALGPAVKKMVEFFGR